MSKISVLDHGYLEAVESWGSDEQIVAAARMSTGKGFLGWGSADALGDEKLLRYLWENKHATPFEMAGMTVEVQAPIFVFREWHRHRTQCLSPNTLIHFESPKSLSGRRSVFKQTIETLWRKWQPTVRLERPERQRNAFWPRTQVAGMLLRNVDEDSGEIGHSSIVDVVRGGVKDMVKVTTTSGKQLTASTEHKMFTSAGWKTLGDAISTGSLLAVESIKRNKPSRWEHQVDTSKERWAVVANTDGKYEVSTAGRVRCVRGYTTQRKTVHAGQILEIKEHATGYSYVVIRYDGTTQARMIHTLVLETFVGKRPPGLEALHENDNKADASLDNLSWGTAKNNAAERVERDRQQRLVVQYEEIVDVEDIGPIQCYDLSVAGPFHNFIANGFVVHNSYNEMSARYVPLPDVNYVPAVERLLVNSKTNKQAGTVKGAETLDEAGARRFQEDLRLMYQRQEALYQASLQSGVPKELARVHLPVGRYSRMRASANLRNWLAFLTLRMADNAQWEIRQYANAIGAVIAEKFPRTWELFIETNQRS
jgi:thymidylate synthase ThyX